MSTAALAEILRSDDLDIDEKDILAAVREWATVNSVRDLGPQYKSKNALHPWETKMIWKMDLLPYSAPPSSKKFINDLF